jgi:uncharacterized surface protein with fasciclin (FAS1) repeats
MVSISPNVQAFNMTHMFDFQDLNVPFGTEKMIIHPNSILGFIRNSNDFKIYNKIIKLARMEGRLNDKQANFTIFIVPDELILKKYNPEVFNRMDENTAQHIINNSLLENIIDKFLLQSSPVSKFITRANKIPMCVMTIRGQTNINQSSNVIHFNQPACNGIIHIIDKIINPNY